LSSYLPYLPGPALPGLQLPADKETVGILLAIVFPPLEWVLAIVAGIAPNRLWRRLEPPLPITRAAIQSGLVTLVLGFTLGVDGFLDFSTRSADLNNGWMLKNVSRFCPPGSCGASNAVALMPYGTSALTLFAFLFFTPLGLLSMYLVLSGFTRALSAWVGDPRGDFLLSGLFGALSSSSAAGRSRVARAAREREEGPEVDDVLATGDWAGLRADYLVIASRRKPEWTAGAIILSSADWYRLEVPIEATIDGRLRTIYPLTRLETPEVVRRGIQYELPPLSLQVESPQRTQRTR
jgi:hypothetical protein